MQAILNVIIEIVPSATEGRRKRWGIGDGWELLLHNLWHYLISFPQQTYQESTRKQLSEKTEMKAFSEPWRTPDTNDI